MVNLGLLTADEKKVLEELSEGDRLANELGLRLVASSHVPAQRAEAYEGLASKGIIFVHEGAGSYRITDVTREYMEALAA